MNTIRKALTLAIGTASLAFAGSVSASPLGLYGAVIDKTSPACLQVGDAISCSAPLLNYLEGNDPNTTVDQGGYVLPSAQGQLSSYIVIASGGGAQGNDDIDPMPGQVEDGFKTTDANPEDFLATGKADGTSMTIGNLNDPPNNALPDAWDHPGTWDVAVTWLIDALTIDGIRRELMIGFDYNQPQNADDASLDYWALITLRDGDNILPDINFEIGTFANALTGTGFFDMPSSTDFATVFGVTCVAPDGTVTPKIGGQCEAGETRIVNAQATNATTIFAFLPELNANLEMYAAMGYDVISSRVLLGCFGGTQAGSFRPGIGYLADEANGGMTTNCETGGFPDIFLLAGAPMDTHQVPVPGTLALLGGALLAGAFIRRRQQA